MNNLPKNRFPSAFVGGSLAALAFTVLVAPLRAGPTPLQPINQVAGTGISVADTLAFNSSLDRLYVGGGVVGTSEQSALKFVDTAANLTLPDPGYQVTQFSSRESAIVAVDAAAGRYYQLDRNGQRIGVCDAATDTLLSTIDLSTVTTTALQTMAINTVTKTAYVIDDYGDYPNTQPGRLIIVSLTTGAVTGSVNTAPVPTTLVIDESLNRIFVGTRSYDANTGFLTVSVVDGATQAVSAVQIPVPGQGAIGKLAVHTALNPQTHRVFVGYEDAYGGRDVNVAAIDGTAGTVVAQVDLGLGSVDALAADPATNRVIVGGYFYDSTGTYAVKVLDAGTNTVVGSIKTSLDDSFTSDVTVTALVDDPVHSRVYAVSDGVAINVIDAQTATRVPGVRIPLYSSLVGNSATQQKSAVDPGTNQLFVLNDGSPSLAFVDLASGRTTHDVPILTAGGDAYPGSVAVNTTTHAVYVTSPSEDAVYVFDGPSATLTASLHVDYSPREMAVDPTRNLLYISTTAGLTVIDGSTNALVTTIGGLAARASAPDHDGIVHVDHTALGVNPVTNRVYVTGNVTVPATDNPHYTTYYPLELDVIDGATFTVIDRVRTGPDAYSQNTGTMAINTKTNKIYLVNSVAVDASDIPIGLYEIDGATDTYTAYAPPIAYATQYKDFGSAALAVNPDLNRVYVVAYGGGTFDAVEYFDAGTHQFTSFYGTVPQDPSLVFDAVHDRLYLSDETTAVYADAPFVDPAFFTGEASLGNGVYYLAFPNGNYFGYYSYLSDPHYLYHFDLGYEYVFDANDSGHGVYLYDFASNGFFYSSPVFPFPYLYDFTLNSVVYYYPDPSNPGRYNTNGYRFFYVFNTGQIISK